MDRPTPWYPKGPLRSYLPVTPGSSSHFQQALVRLSLPNAVIEAFASPLDLQFRWAKPLNDAQQSDPEGLLERATKLKGQGVDLGSRAVFEALIGSSTGRVDQAGKIELEAKGKAFGSLGSDATGRVVLRTSAALNDAQRSTLAKLVEEFAEREGL